LRRAAAVATAVALACTVPAGAANKDMERMQIQLAALQGQFAELQRTGEETLRELKRLNELLAEQSALLKKAVQDQHAGDETTMATLRELAERVGEVRESVAALRTLPGTAPPPSDLAGSPAATPGATPGPTVSGATTPATAPPPAPRELYSQAYGDYARGNYDLAIAEFSEYIRAYPSTDFTDNAQYWIGECLYSKQQYAEAIEAWNTLFRDYPSSDKLPDARYKKGMALERLGRRSQALQEYRFVMDHFPNSDAARKSREKLNP
jgi:tol-pal system protein YbgF